MKRVIVLCTLAILSFGFTQAQTTDNKLVFASEASKFEANTSRNRVKLYETAYTTLDNMMQQEITNNKAAAINATGSAKQALTYKIKMQEQYYGEITALSADKIKNRVAIKIKLDSFQQSL